MRALLLAVLVLLATPAAGAAYFVPGAAVISASDARRELADDASQSVAISGDGRFAVFQTRATNLFADDDPDPEGTDRLGGIFRRDLASGALTLVGAGDQVAEEDGSLQRLGARNPSVSADGRYVSFSTAYGLVDADTNDAVDVYVRDLRTGRATLVSAQDRTDAPAEYATDPAQPAGQRPGADVWPLTSISADGRRVVFRTTTVSDLAGPDTPAGELFVRDLGARTTQLVTRVAADGTPAGGALGPAAISADGSAVVWTGANAGAQTRFLSGEPYSDTDAFYLWRRVAAGAAAPTRRITGLADLDDPRCNPATTIGADPTATGPCYGPLTTPDQGSASISGRQLAISKDGYTVWYLTPGFPRPAVLASGVLDLWSANLRPGVSRKAGAVELTREGAPDDLAADGGIDGLSVSPDGRWLAFSTLRTKFPGGRLALTGAPRSVPDQREVYLADLRAGTFERVVTGYDGEDATGGGASSGLSLSADGRKVGFVSAASNLFFGDANARADAFVAIRTDPPAADPPPPPVDETNDDVVAIPPPDPPRLRVKVSRAKNRSVVLRITVPAAGKLVVRARGRVPASGGKRKPLRTFAQGRAAAKRPATVRVTLRPGRAAKRPLRRFRRLSASARVTFTPAAGGAKLVAARRVRFLAAPRKHGRKRGRKPRLVTSS